jgi:hypothetical protein
LTTSKLSPSITRNKNLFNLKQLLTYKGLADRMKLEK